MFSRDGKMATVPKPSICTQCNKDLSHLNNTNAQRHLNSCLEKSKKRKFKDKDKVNVISNYFSKKIQKVEILCEENGNQVHNLNLTHDENGVSSNLRISKLLAQSKYDKAHRCETLF